MLIGFVGPEGAGKSTAAAIAAQVYKGKVLPFAAPLKAMVAALGVDPRHLYGTPEEKEAPLAIFGGKSARHALQTLGTEWGRQHISPGFWGDMWEVWARETLAAGKAVVADDVRFANEAERVKRLGGIVVRVIRSEADRRRVPRHASEDFMAVPADVEVFNDGCRHDLRVRVLTAIKTARKVPA